VSAYIAPLLWVHGVVRSVTERIVPAVPAITPSPAVPPRYDDHGQITDPGTPAHEGREGRPAYTCYDVVLDTMRPGAQVAAGFVEVVITPKALEVTEGYLPALGDDVEWPIRGFQKWYGAPGRRRSTNGYSFAGDVYAAERSQGKRSVSAVAANAS
jgi:hypothetical protein